MSHENKRQSSAEPVDLEFPAFLIFGFSSNLYFLGKIYRNILLFGFINYDFYSKSWISFSWQNCKFSRQISRSFGSSSISAHFHTRLFSVQTAPCTLIQFSDFFQTTITIFNYSLCLKHQVKQNLIFSYYNYIWCFCGASDYDSITIAFTAVQIIIRH